MLKFFVISAFLVCFFNEVESVFNQPRSYDHPVSSYRSRSIVTCRSVSLKNGRVRFKKRNSRFVKFVCNAGYILSGQKFSVCENGQWNSVPPHCVRPTCTSVKPPVNGFIYPTHSGAVLHFYCKPMYTLRGNTEIHCEGDSWNDTAPVCMLTGAKPQLFCDFENEDLCGWSDDVKDNFDWTRENYKTPSGEIGTGPRFDHTKGEGKDGYYMYIESSSRSVDDVARLISPVFEASPSGASTCLEFYYHMYGVDTGSLRVYLKNALDGWNLKPEDAIFAKSGNQGDVWYRSYQSLGVIGYDYQIVIEGVRGRGYVSDTAVDDVRLVENCVYVDEEVSTTPEYDGTTESLLTVESCFDRCGLKAGAGANESAANEILCDCDDSCFDRNRCCPDYYDSCVANASTELDATNPTTTIDLMSTMLYKTTAKKHYTNTTVLNTKPTTSLKITQATAPPTMPRTTRKKLTFLTTSKLPILKTTTATIPTKKYRTYIPFNPFRTIKSTSTTFKPKAVTNRWKDKENDVITVTEKNTVALPAPKKEGKQLEVKENEVESPADVKHSKKESVVMSDKSHFLNKNSIFLVVVGVAVVSILLVSGLVFFTKRYGCRGRRLRSSANGDSQSDVVGFFAHDEVLNFDLNQDYEK